MRLDRDFISAYSVAVWNLAPYPSRAPLSQHKKHGNRHGI